MTISEDCILSIAACFYCILVCTLVCLFVSLARSSHSLQETSSTYILEYLRQEREQHTSKGSVGLETI